MGEAWDEVYTKIITNKLVQIGNEISLANEKNVTNLHTNMCYQLIISNNYLDITEKKCCWIAYM